MWHAQRRQASQPNVATCVQSIATWPLLLKQWLLRCSRKPDRSNPHSVWDWINISKHFYLPGLIATINNSSAYQTGAHQRRWQFNYVFFFVRSVNRSLRFRNVRYFLALGDEQFRYLQFTPYRYLARIMEDILICSKDNTEFGLITILAIG